MPNQIEQFLTTFNKIDKDSLHLLSSIYADDIVFIDPLHQIQGIQNLQQYFKNMYDNIDSCHFDFEQTLQQDNSAVVFWLLQFKHPKLNKGNIIKVSGSSHLRFEDKVIYHRDYFDVGNMLYEHIPLLRTGIKFLKNRLVN